MSTTDKSTLVTKEGLDKLKQELTHLKDVRRKEVATRLKEAISYGDLSENSEYEEAKNEQAFLEGRILELEEKVKSAKIIKSSGKTKTVQLGSKVKVKDLSDSGDTIEYTIVGSTEADPLNHMISNESPVGAALLDKSAGDTVTVKVPAGEVQYEVVKFS